MSLPAHGVNRVYTRFSFEMDTRMQPGTFLTPEMPQVIGPFRIVRTLGVGGMGTVYLGERISEFKQQVAIKILNPHLFPENREAAIEQEGQLLASLDHPGIVRMLDIGVTTEGAHYIVMEYVDGVPLDDFCDRHRLPLRRRIEILIDTLEAIEYAHRHLIVHADLKPANVLVTEEGKPRLLDFGVAGILSGIGAQASNSDQYTGAYASPEQRSGERLAVSSDIFSAGLIAQRLILGVEPKTLPVDLLHAADRAVTMAVSAKSLTTLDESQLQQISDHRDTTPAKLIATIRGDLEAILGKALRIEPSERFQNLQEMIDEFRRYLLGYPIHTRPVSRLTQMVKWTNRNRLAALLGFILIVVVILSVVGVIVRARDAAHKRQIAITRLHELVRLTDVLASELYDSVHGLPGAEDAQIALLKSAHQSIDKLAIEENQDQQLQLELAREYEKLARLELQLTPQTATSLHRAQEDLTQELKLLQGLPARDPEVIRLLHRIPEIVALEKVATAK